MVSNSARDPGGSLDQDLHSSLHPIQHIPNGGILTEHPIPQARKGSLQHKSDPNCSHVNTLALHKSQAHQQANTWDPNIEAPTYLYQRSLLQQHSRLQTQTPLGARLRLRQNPKGPNPNPSHIYVTVAAADNQWWTRRPSWAAKVNKERVAVVPRWTTPRA